MGSGVEARPLPRLTGYLTILTWAHPSYAALQERRGVLAAAGGPWSGSVDLTL